MPNLNLQVLLKKRGRNGPDMLTYVATKLLKFIKTIMTKNNYIFKSIIIPKSETDLGYYLAGLSFVLRPSSFVLRPSSFVLRRR